MRMAKHIEQIVLLAGNSNYRALVQELQRRRVRVTIISTLRANHAMIASELRRQADRFFDITDLQSKLLS